MFCGCSVVAGVLWWLSKFTGRETVNENVDAGEEITVLLGFSLCKWLVTFQINLRGKKPFLDRAFDDAAEVVRLCCPCTTSIKMLEGLRAKNTSLTPQQWFVLAFLEERVPLISETVKFILGFALFSFWDVNSCALQLKKVQNAVAVLGSAPAAGSSLC